MEFFGQLGIDPKLLIAQIINFTLLLLILKALVYGPLIRKIEEDEEKLKKAQQIQLELEKEKADFLTQKAEEEKETKLRSDKIIDEATQIARDIRTRAQIEMDTEKEAVLKQIKSRLSSLDYERGRE